MDEYRGVRLGRPGVTAADSEGEAGGDSCRCRSANLLSVRCVFQWIRPKTQPRPKAPKHKKAVFSGVMRLSVALSSATSPMEAPRFAHSAA